jgi:membrane protease YdiL (CAAX protease family)
LPILLTAFIGLLIIAVSETGIIILRQVDAQLIRGVWPLFVIGEVLQCGFALLGIAIARRFLKTAKFGLRWPHDRTLVGVAIIWGFAFGFIMLIMDSGRGFVAQAHAHAQHPVDIAGWLLFQILLPGLGEETLFRGLLLGILEALSPSRLRIRKFSISTAGITIAILFALAHSASFFTGPWLAALGQQLYAVALGILYAWLREKSGSLLAPIIAHNLSDFTETAAIFVLAALLPHAS